MRLSELVWLDGNTIRFLFEPRLIFTMSVLIQCCLKWDHYTNFCACTRILFGTQLMFTIFVTLPGYCAKTHRYLRLTR